MLLVRCIEVLFARHGHDLHEGERAERVTSLEHALQCAYLAECVGADDELVAAALLHDIGHFIDAPQGEDGVDDAHELRVVPFLSPGFGDAVIGPIRWHVQAKRYLVSSDASYARSLSPASTVALVAQGGPMTLDEMRWFESLPFAQQALRLRRWDDGAKTPGRHLRSMEYYAGLLRRLAGSAQVSTGCWWARQTLADARLGATASVF